MKLTYFNLMGRAELARMILAQAKVDYVDERIERENWPQLKPTIVTGQLPALEVEKGKVICQSMAIARYLAKKYGLAGSGELEQAQVDMVAECIADTMNTLAQGRLQTHPEAQKMFMEKAKTEVMPRFFGLMEKFLKESTGEYLVGNKVTYADLFLALFVRFIKLRSPIGEDALIPPVLEAFQHKVESLPNIKEWIEKRPKTEY